MHEYWCDGMPTQTGCSRQADVPRKVIRPGRKRNGWLFCWPLSDGDTEDRSEDLLAFCPSCATHVEAFERSRATPEEVARIRGEQP